MSRWLTRARLLGAGWSAAYLLVTRLSTVAAVPLVLTHLGSDLYAAWVLAGTLVMSQGLVDFGVASATIRYVAVGAAAQSRRSVLGALRASAYFYAGLSAAFALALLLSADALIDLVPYLREPGDSSAARALVAYTAGAFVLTNAVLLMSALLQGIGRVDAAFRAQTLGWLAYVPVLAIGLETGGAIDAVGLAWVIAYAAQVGLLLVESLRALRSLGQRDAPIPGLRDLVALGLRWQVSSYADFATFQLPRLVAGVALPSASLVSLDLAMRGAQLVVSPFFAVYPLVLPAATDVWAKEGERGVGERLARWAGPFAAAILFALVLAVPLLPPAIALWSDQSIADINVAVCAFVSVGVVAHSATGPLTSALLATGSVRAVIEYKVAQLILAAALLAVATGFDVVGFAAALGAALLLPAARFLWHAGRRFEPLRRRLGELPWGRLLLSAALCCGPALFVLAQFGDTPPLVVGLAVAGTMVPLLGAAVKLTGTDWLAPSMTASSRA